MNAKTALTLLISLGFAAGCTGAKPENTGTARAQLHRAGTCADLEKMLKADATAKLNAYIDGQIDAVNRYGYGGYGGGYGTPVAQPGAAASDTLCVRSTYSYATCSVA